MLPTLSLPIQRNWLAIPSTVWAWLLSSLAWRTCVAWLLPVGFDEVYYYVYSRHLNWSYFDHPPLVAMTTGIGWWLTDSLMPLTIRLGALGLYTLSLLLLYWVAAYLFEPQTGILTVAIASITPILWLTFGVLTAPDNSLIFGWTLTLLIAAYEFLPRRMATPRPAQSMTYRPSWRIALLGLTLGLTCLSKYHGFILGLGLVGFCLTNNRVRKALWSPWTVLSLLIFGLTLMPLWWWNSQHEWISFRFHLFMRFAGDEPSRYRIWDAVGTWLLGIAYLFPTVGLPLWWTAGRSFLQHTGRWFKPPLTGIEQIRHDRVALVLWVSLPITLGFTWLGGKQAIYPAWPAPGFWGLTILLAYSVSQWSPKWIRRWLTGTGLVVATLVTVALLHLTLGILQKPGNYSPFGGLVPIEQDGSTSLLDMMQLRSQIASSDVLRQDIATTNFIFTDEFYLSAYVDMALQPLTEHPITCFSQDPRGFAFWHDGQSWVGQNALYITLASIHPDRDALVTEFQPYFQTLSFLQAIPLQRGGAVAETVLIYRADTMQTPYRYPYPAPS